LAEYAPARVKEKGALFHKILLGRGYPRDQNRAVMKSGRGLRQQKKERAFLPSPSAFF